MSSSPEPPRAALYVVLSNISGRQNMGTYLRTASAFGATQVIVVGSQRFGTHGAHRAHKYVDVLHFYNFGDARAYLKEKGCAIVGIKRSSDSHAAHAKSYSGSTAFVIDNEGGALSADQVAICDSFVHVPFHGPQKAPLTLDATVVVAIVFHHFTKWAKFPVRPFEPTSTQGKFVLDTFPISDGTDARSQQIAAEREAKRAFDVDELMSDELSNIFG